MPENIQDRLDEQMESLLKIQHELKRNIGVLVFEKVEEEMKCPQKKYGN